MSAIEGSVGQDGDNREPDVRVVQRLLNGHDLAPLATLAEDGRSGSQTIEAIRHFQTRYLGIQSPDGRVDPDGRTIRKLNTGTKNERGTGENAETRKADRAEERGTGENAETRKEDRALRAERVDPRVQETAVTTRIIDALVPQFGNTRAKIIAGYLSDADQFWKVNYHWEYLLQMVDHSLTLQVEDADRKELQSIRSTLMSCSPDPSTGYASSPIGKPEDRSSIEDVIKRYKLLKGAKESFRKVTDRADLKGKSTKSDTMFYLAAAPVAYPGTSKHGKGYAVDIAGDNGSIKSLCSGLGATLVFDEKSHVHVEFKNGLSG